MLESLKQRLGTATISTPLFEFDGELHQLDGLRGIIQRSNN